MRQIHVIAAVAAIAMTASTPAFAEQETRLVELKAIYPYLEAYWKLPAGERSRFRLGYAARLEGAPAGSLKAAYVDGGKRTPISFDADGRMSPMPTPAMFAARVKVELSAPKGSKLKESLLIEPVQRPAAELDARDLSLAVAQAAAGAKKAAGMMGFAVPKFERVVFKGAGGGQAVDASGRAIALAVVKGSPVFDPQLYPQARLLRFAKAPSQMLIGPIK